MIIPSIFSDNTFDKVKRLFLQLRNTENQIFIAIDRNFNSCKSLKMA